MGTLRKYALNDTGCDIFFETGTGLGHSLKHALDNGKFKKIYSSEIHTETALKAQKLFEKNISVKIINANSLTALKEVLTKVPLSTPICFFLDAHFPGEVEKDFNYSNNVPNNQSMPLKDELIFISSLRKDSEDIIIIDDLKLYEDGPFANGVIDKNFANIPDSFRDLSFVYQLYPLKKIERDYQDDGYLIIKPQTSSFSLKKVSQFYRFKRSLKKNIARFFK
jgi:hypothetical protein